MEIKLLSEEKFRTITVRVSQREYELVAELDVNFNKLVRDLIWNTYNRKFAVGSMIYKPGFEEVSDE